MIIFSIIIKGHFDWKALFNKYNTISVSCAYMYMYVQKHAYKMLEEKCMRVKKINDTATKQLWD